MLGLKEKPVPEGSTQRPLVQTWPGSQSELKLQTPPPALPLPAQEIAARAERQSAARATVREEGTVRVVRVKLSMSSPLQLHIVKSPRDGGSSPAVARVLEAALA